MDEKHRKTANRPLCGLKQAKKQEKPKPHNGKGVQSATFEIIAQKLWACETVRH